jgi:hypothetical protein
VANQLTTPARLVALAALGGATLGLIAHTFLFTGYRARIAFPMGGEVALMRRIDDAIRSPQWFKDYASAYEGDAGTKSIMAAEFGRARPSQIKIESAWRIQRGDVKDLPEAVVKDLAVLRDPRTDLTATVTDRDPVKAQFIAEMAIRFVRYVALRVALTDLIPPWRQQIEREAMDWRVKLASMTSDLEASQRRIKDLEALRDRFKEFAAANPTVSGVQVQVTGPRYLSVVQQLIGLESERVDMREQQRQAIDAVTRTEVLRRLVLQFEEIYKTERNLDRATARMEEIAVAEVRAAEAPGVPLANRIAAIGALRTISGLRERFVDALFLPPSAVVRPDGLPRSWLLLAGALLASLAAILVLKLRELKSSI